MGKGVDKGALHKNAFVLLIHQCGYLVAKKLFATELHSPAPGTPNTLYSAAGFGATELNGDVALIQCATQRSSSTQLKQEVPVLCAKIRACFLKQQTEKLNPA